MTITSTSIPQPPAPKIYHIDLDSREAHMLRSMVGDASYAGVVCDTNYSYEEVIKFIDSIYNGLIKELTNKK
jgi:hypothetical protein